MLWRSAPTTRRASPFLNGSNGTGTLELNYLERQHHQCHQHGQSHDHDHASRMDSSSGSKSPLPTSSRNHTGVNGTFVIASVPSPTTFTITTAAPGAYSYGGAQLTPPYTGASPYILRNTGRARSHTGYPGRGHRHHHGSQHVHGRSDRRHCRSGGLQRARGTISSRGECHDIHLCAGRQSGHRYDRQRHRRPDRGESLRRHADELPPPGQQPWLDRPRGRHLKRCDER